MTELASLSGPVYWAAGTGTAVPTQTVFLGTTTPVYAETPVPAQITTTPDWTTVTPPWPTPPTPSWVTTTPMTITETPPPPATTTPGLPLIGYTTPVPQATAYYRVGTFYLDSDVYAGGPYGIVVRLTGHQSQPSPRQAGAAYHYLFFRLTNHGDEPVTVPLAELVFIRRVRRDETMVAGRWTPQNEPLIARGLPGYAAQGAGEPLPPGEERDLILGFVLPEGEVPEAGLITDWRRPVEGGLPVWFYLTEDPLGPLEDAVHPPPPTPVVLDEGGGEAGDGDGAGRGNGGWPTTGTVTRGFGCAESYTGVDGAGFGCPDDRPWFHNGVDIADATGTAVWSPIAGTVLYAGPHTTGPDCSHLAGSEAPHEGLGNYQRIGDGHTLHYFGHLSAFLITAGDVAAGETVAEMGSTGCSTGPHLHWTMYQNGVLVDPAVWAGAR
jgi:murein DD-endopeptidase MepM/ murein hydrolase activator NlpD